MIFTEADWTQAEDTVPTSAQPAHAAQEEGPLSRPLRIQAPRAL